MDVSERIRNSTRPVDGAALRAQVISHIDEQFDLDQLLGPSANHAGPSTVPLKRIDSRRSQRRKRGIEEEIDYWKAKEAAAEKELAETSSTLPGLLQESQEKLAELLASAQTLSLRRYGLADKLSTLISELDSSRRDEDDDAKDRAGQSVLEEMEVMQEELAGLEAGLAWVRLLEDILVLSDKTLDPNSHRPSPLAALPHYTALDALVKRLEGTLPPGMALLRLILDVRQQTWAGLKDVMTKDLLRASEGLKWPVKVDYPSVPATQRRAFERAFQDLLYLQAEGENLGRGHDSTLTKREEWHGGHGLYPLQALIQPIRQRFKYHFQGSRNTNRVDKPEWAFTNVLDQVYEHQAFIDEYLQPLTNKAGFSEVDVRSEFTLLLLPMLLSMLKSRIPHLLSHPALLAHTIYQTVIFDDAVREGGFDFSAVSINSGTEPGEWEGLAGVLLRQEDWFQQWLQGEKRFAENQLHEIISSPEAWTISEESQDEDTPDKGLKPSNSARQVKAVFEQITDRYAPLPSLEHNLSFLTGIQLPLLASYHSRISGSLDAFETLSSTFARHVPGALSGNTRGGVHVDQAKLTGGKAGLERLLKASISASFILAALRIWADEAFFVEMSNGLRHSEPLRNTIQDEVLIPYSIRSGDVSRSTSVFDVLIDRFGALSGRTEEMMVKHVSAEVENDLKQHLTRRWDRAATVGEETIEPSTSLVNSLTTLSSHLSTLHSILPPLATLRVYRRVVQHLSNHIQNRAVYSGWSKFSPGGGKDFAEEVDEWIGISKSAAPSVNIPGGLAAVEAPWERLRDISRILSLPADEGDGPTFAQAMAAAWSDGEESYGLFCQRVGVSLDRQDLRGVLKRRLDCWM